MNNLKFKTNRQWRERVIIMGVADYVCTLVSYFLALLVRHDFLFSAIEPEFIQGYTQTAPIWALVLIVVLYIFKLYHSIWSMASIPEMYRIIGAYAVQILFCIVLVIVADLHMPRSYYVMGTLFSALCTTCIRFSYRMIRFRFGGANRPQADKQRRIMVIGAGAAGQMLIRELHNSDKINSNVACVIDDNPYKHDKLIEGVQIVGDRYDIVRMARTHNITDIIFAIPSIGPKEKSDILNICKETGCRVRTVPGMYQLVNDEVRVSQLRDVEIADLLGREQILVNNDEILADLEGRVILVTGGGGSIGSELCRQIARSNPAKLIIFDIYENNAYDIQLELKTKYPELDLTVLIGSVRNTNRIRFVMETYQPDIVFHAAAHKHVPLMEDSPNEAIKNNVLGTFKTAEAAAMFGVKKFVLISTDKAVNPTNIMGASKRLCEMIVQMMSRRCSDTSFVAVRFGNVLGSNGSVIPLFKKQIAQGGPVTVTDKRVIRYFMTIPEAVSLVLQASSYADGGEIFVLEMGEPVKIDDMARNLIRLSGYKPDVDIKIVYTGLRPGEKLYEELLMDEEGLKETENKMIHIGRPIEMDDAWFLEKIRELEQASKDESDRIRELVAELVPTYRYRAEE